ncbi:MAG: hypothetical protein BAW33_06360 [Desulfobacterales bacterium C00003104]|jgi:hypothetical protein|nr:MAG: hypothetical protein BAW33_06360 [Desulfobacterales bacterium C00003104]
MTENKPKERSEIAKSFFFAYLILILNIVLVLLVGTVVIFFKGITDYVIWILVSGALLVAICSFLFWRRIKQSGRTLKETMKDPIFEGRSVQVDLLGGLFSVKMGHPTIPGTLSLGDGAGPHLPQLEDPLTVRTRGLTRLADLLEKNLITRQEFLMAKEDLMRPSQQQ